MFLQEDNKKTDTNVNARDKLKTIQQKVNKLESHYRQLSTGSYKAVKYNPNELQFIPPSPFFNFVHRYPRLAGLANQFLYWDTNLCINVNRLSMNPSIAAFFKAVSRLGDGWFWYAMLATASVIGGFAQFYLVIATIITSLLGVAIYKVLKVKTVRPRPYQVHQVIRLGERPLDVFSFPSGHTMQAVLFTCVLGAFFPILLWVMAPFAVLVAISRMVLGLHYPTDVFVGAILGFALSFLAPALARNIEPFVGNLLTFMT